ncbi:TetR/AcrR family transcriptional regulator [Amycolatopsis sp. CA-230715]|uniref:TetR/AcrR family transcriptional regulator n=1 Tax=Amycolatopsis sp. CA-230715 TaxID=2745196 RepID=UPI001C02D75F|nr:TetR/AcrR family transcriptional regulator [Amycolatopsis sp. CA-230715]
MPRPRLLDVDHVLDVAEELLAARGAAGVTLRTLAASAEVSNGSLYHAFGSLPALLGRTWLRAARRFLVSQAERAEAALPDSAAATVAAACTPADFADRHPAAARLLLFVRRDALLGPDLPETLADELVALDREVVTLLKRLADAHWGRHDARAVEAMTACVVDLPTALLRRSLELPGPVGTDARDRLETAVLAVLAVPLPKERHA